MEQNKQVEDKIYSLIYEKSTLVNGVRVCFEDEWPIEAITRLILQERIDEVELALKTAVHKEPQDGGSWWRGYTSGRNRVRRDLKKRLAQLNEGGHDGEA